NVARMMGRAVAAQQRHTPAGAFLEDVRKSVETCIERGLALSSLAALFNKSGVKTEARPRSDRSASTTTKTKTARDHHKDDLPEVTSLAIPSYASLSAGQIIARLDGLSVEDLNAIRAYETATRKRKTILARIDEMT